MMSGPVRVKCLFCTGFYPFPSHILFYFEVWCPHPHLPIKFPACVIGLPAPNVFHLCLLASLASCFPSLLCQVVSLLYVSGPVIFFPCVFPQLEFDQNSVLGVFFFKLRAC